jgi:RNA polymerase sigma factor for flagellar operon FliA
MTAVERDSLIAESLPLVKRIAFGVQLRVPSCVDPEDLIQSGILGLIDAIDKFDPGRTIKFTTYARLRIQGAILDSLRDLDWSPRSLRKQSRGLEHRYRELSQSLGRACTDNELATAAGLDLDEFYALTDQLNGLHLYSLEELNDQASLREDPSPGPETTFELSQSVGLLLKAIEDLHERDRRMLSMHYDEELTFSAIGAALGVSESRVSQLHTGAIASLRNRLSRQMKHVTVN